MRASNSTSANGLLEAIEITKQYSSVRVIEGVNCALRPGRVPAVIGEDRRVDAAQDPLGIDLVDRQFGEAERAGVDVGRAARRPPTRDPPDAAIAGANGPADRGRNDVGWTPCKRGPPAVPSPRLGGGKARRATVWRLRVESFRQCLGPLEPESETGRHFLYRQQTRPNSMLIALIFGHKRQRPLRDRHGAAFGRLLSVPAEVAFSEIGPARDPGRPRFSCEKRVPTKNLGGEI